MKWYEETFPIEKNIDYFFKWTVISCLIGIVVGLIGTAFGKGVIWASGVWKDNHWTLFLMPLSGLVIVGLYKLFREEKNGGTNTVLAAISSNEEITVATAPLIFASWCVFLSGDLRAEGPPDQQARCAD